MPKSAPCQHRKGLTMKNIVNLRLPCMPSSVIIAEATVTAMLQQANASDKEIEHVKIAMSEAVSNCVYWAYPNSDDGKISITMQLEKEKLTITINDSGVGIEDIGKACSYPYTTSPSNEHSGEGFTIMNNLMDRLKVRSSLDNGTTVILRKQIHIQQ